MGVISAFAQDLKNELTISVSNGIIKMCNNIY